MKRQLIYIIMYACATCAGAQDFPERDNQGNVIYYKIFSAAPDCAGLCLTDNTADASTDYKYLMTGNEADNRYQEWRLIADETAGCYHLRNRATYRYVSTSGTYVDIFYAITFATKQAAGNALLFTSLTNDGQWSMTYKDGVTTKYMGVGDETKGLDIFRKTDLPGTARAWYIVPSGQMPPNAVEATSKGHADIRVVDHRIVVSGCSSYEIYDVQGRQVPCDTELQPGLYVVKADDTVKNIMVK